MKSLLQSKKAQFSIGMLGVLAIVIVTAAIVIAIGSNILDDVQEEVDTETKQLEQTIAVVNNSHNALTGFSGPNIVQSIIIYNDSLRTHVMLSGEFNYTLFATNKSVFINTTDSTASNYTTNLYAVVTGLYYETAAYNATAGGLEGTNTFADWLDTIALIIVAAVVIGIIATSFGQQGK